MADLVKEVNRELKIWFKGVVTSLDNDPDLIDAMPNEDVEHELKKLGVDADKFHSKITKTVATAKLKNAMGKLITWLSPVWEPMWAGQPVTAADIRPQEYSFPLEDGSIQITCTWDEDYHKKTAMIRFSWEAQISTERTFWVRFVNPETHEVRHEACLGKYPSGEETFTSNELGFDPCHDVWGVSVYTT